MYFVVLRPSHFVVRKLVRLERKKPVVVLYFVVRSSTGVVLCSAGLVPE